MTKEKLTEVVARFLENSDFVGCSISFIDKEGNLDNTIISSNRMMEDLLIFERCFITVNTANIIHLFSKFLEQETKKNKNFCKTEVDPALRRVLMLEFLQNNLKENEDER